MSSALSAVWFGTAGSSELPLIDRRDPWAVNLCGVISREDLGGLRLSCARAQSTVAVAALEIIAAQRVTAEFDTGNADRIAHRTPERVAQTNAGSHCLHGKVMAEHGGRQVAVAV